MTELKILCKYIKKNLKTEFIEHFSFTIILLIIFILKKNRTLKLIINYRKLNKIRVKNNYLLLLIIETLNKLNNIKIFSKFNIKNTYHCIKIQKDNK